MQMANKRSGKEHLLNFLSGDGNSSIILRNQPAGGMIVNIRIYIPGYFNESHATYVSHLLSLFMNGVLPSKGRGILVGDRGLVWKEHGRRSKHIAERVMQ